MTESTRKTADVDRAKNVETEQVLGRKDLPSSGSAQRVGVYEQPDTDRGSSSNMMWMILLILLIIVVAYFVLRQWM